MIKIELCVVLLQGTKPPKKKTMREIKKRSQEFIRYEETR